MRISDWSSDVCSSVLGRVERGHAGVLFDDAGHGGHRRVAHGIARMQVDDVAEGDAQGRVRIRIHRPALRLAIADQALHVRRAQAQQFAGKRSEEHTSELQSLMRISYAVFCLKKKTNTNESKLTRKQH